MWDPKSLARDLTHASCLHRVFLTHWRAREVPRKIFITDFIFFLPPRRVRKEKYLKCLSNGPK